MSGSLSWPLNMDDGSRIKGVDSFYMGCPTEKVRPAAFWPLVADALGTTDRKMASPQVVISRASTLDKGCSTEKRQTGRVLAIICWCIELHRSKDGKPPGSLYIELTILEEGKIRSPLLSSWRLDQRGRNGSREGLLFCGVGKKKGGGQYSIYMQLCCSLRGSSNRFVSEKFFGWRITQSEYRR